MVSLEKVDTNQKGLKPKSGPLAFVDGVGHSTRECTKWKRIDCDIDNKDDLISINIFHILKKSAATRALVKNKSRDMTNV
jgi:hypothetical protein